MEQFVRGSKAPLALQLFVTFATTVGGTTVPALAESPRPGYTVAVRGEVSLGRLNRDGEPADLAPVLYEPDRWLARPVEARDVLRVDGQRNVLCLVFDADPVLGEQTPHLTGAEVAVPVVVIVREPGLANTWIIAVALTRVAGRRATKEVHFVVACDVLGRVDVAPRFQGDAALLGAEAQLVLIVERRVQERDCAKWRIAGARSVFVTLTPRAFHRDVRAGHRIWMVSNQDGGPLVGTGTSAA